MCDSEKKPPQAPQTHGDRSSRTYSDCTETAARQETLPVWAPSKTLILVWSERDLLQYLMALVCKQKCFVL